MAARVERLGPDMLLQIPSEPRHHLLRITPHALAPEFVVENVVQGRGIQLIRVGVQERGSDFLDTFIVQHVLAIVVFGVVLDHSGSLELIVVDLRVAQCYGVCGDGVEGRVQAHGCGEVCLFVCFPVSFDGRTLGEEFVVVGGSVVVVVEY